MPYSTPAFASRLIKPLAATDLSATLAPLDRYGPSGLSAALAEALMALTAPGRGLRKPTVGILERSRLTPAVR